MKKSRILALVLSLLMLILQIPISAFAESETLDLPKDGSWYLIGTAEDLYKFADYVNTTYKANYSAGTETSIKAKLTADIDLNPGVEFSYDEATGKIKVKKDDKTAFIGSGLCGTTRSDRSGDTIELKKWNPISGSSVEFDGDGHTVDGVYVVGSENYPAAGFLGNIWRGSAKNITIGKHSIVLNNIDLTSSATGGVVGIIRDGVISNCKNNAIICGYSSTPAINCRGAGGIAGICDAPMSDCENLGTVIGEGSAGGIVGMLVKSSKDSLSVIHSCVNRGNVFTKTEGYSYAGGIAGVAGYSYGFSEVSSGTASYCFNYGRVVSTYAGGIFGHAAVNASIKSCGNFGEVTGMFYAVGLCAAMNGSNNGLSIKKSFNAGKLKLTDSVPSEYTNPPRVKSAVYGVYGGIVETVTVENCYNDSSVFGGKMADGDYRKILSKCYDVTPEVFATGEPAFYMSMKQELPIPEIEGKTPQTYPDETSTRSVFKTNRYCCHTDDANKEAHKKILFSNGGGDITDEHTPNENGICSHCKKDVRTPQLSPDVLEKGKVADYYYMKIDASSDSVPVTFSLANSETDDTEYTLPDGLSGDTYYNYSSELGKNIYYYVIRGTPQTTGIYNFVLKATNEYGTTVKPYTLVIENADALVITTGEKLYNATVGKSYNAYIWKNLSLDGVWSGSSLPNGLSINKKDGTISGTPTTAGDYSFTVTVSCAGQTASKTFFLTVLEEGGCKHGKMSLVKGMAATCISDGRADYYHCEICGCDYEDEGGENEIWELRQLTTAKNHTDSDNDGLCDYCHKPMPLFKKVTNESEIMTASTYVLAAEIKGEQYLLTYPLKSDGYGLDYGDYMPSAKVTLQSDNTFAFSSLADAGVMMLTPEFAARNGKLDAGLPRYDLSSVIGGIRYGLTEGMAGFDMYPNEPAKYGYRITLDENGTVKLASVYSEYWGADKVGNGLLLAFDMNYNNESTKFFTFNTADDYSGEKANYAGATLTEYPIYLYRMVYVDSANGKTYTTNDGNADFTADGELRDFYAGTNADFSNVSGISNSVSREALQNAIAEAQTDDSELFVSTYAKITAVSREHENDGKTDRTTSLGFSITPYVNISSLNGYTFDKELSNSDLCGAPITVTLYVGDFNPEQIIHYKKDGTKEYFYPEHSERAENGAKTFARESDSDENTYITFTITDFSDFKVLESAESEIDYENKISYDSKTLKITCAKAGEYTLVFANYDKTEKMTAIKTLTQKFTQGETVIDALPDGVSLTSGDKIFLWESLSTLKPLCEAFTVK